MFWGSVVLVDVILIIIIISIVVVLEVDRNNMCTILGNEQFFSYFSRNEPFFFFFCYLFDWGVTIEV